jgi:hypothetical protein
LGADDAEVGQAVPAESDGHRQVEDDLAGVVDRTGPTPGRQGPAQSGVQTGEAGGVDQE